MYKQKRTKNRRYSKTSGNSHGRNSSGRGGEGSGNRKSSKSRSSSNSRYSSGKSGGYRPKRSGGHWKKKNRRRFTSKIDHSVYVSKAEDVMQAPKYIPENAFHDMDLRKDLAQNISDVGYVNPTKIQDQAIPMILEGKDILGLASTGSGKTGAFLIPMINKALNNKDEKILIITPTRELASQIQNEFRKFAKNTGLRMTLVIGGTSIRTQIHHLKQKPQFVVATPGRLMDLAERNRIKLGTFNNIVLDEVDQMLDMGFVNDIKMIISKLAEEKQTLFFSATMSSKEEGLANSLLVNPIKVEVHKQSPLKSIHQDIVKVSTREEKMGVLHDLVKKSEFHKVLVFSGTKRYADKISKELRNKGVKIDSLHGGKSQNKRSRVLENFRRDRLDVLVATDVAARGIDIPDISHVINYDEPATYSDYIHRIGRTGRIGKKGTALTFVISKETY